MTTLHWHASADDCIRELVEWFGPDADYALGQAVFTAARKVGAIYYDYEYTGSGTPVGKPQKIEDVQDGKAYSMLPAIDEVWDLYTSMTLKF